MTEYKQLATATFIREARDINNNVVPVRVKAQGYVDDNEELQVCLLKISLQAAVNDYEGNTINLLNDAADELSAQFKEVRR